MAVNGTITAAGTDGKTFVPKTAPEIGELLSSIFVDGAGVATFQLERQPPGSTNWYPITAAATQLYVWSYTGISFGEDFSEGVPGTAYRVNCTSFTSGSINYQIQGGIE